MRSCSDSGKMGGKAKRGGGRGVNQHPNRGGGKGRGEGKGKGGRLGENRESL